MLGISGGGGCSRPRFRGELGIRTGVCIAWGILMLKTEDLGQLFVMLLEQVESP